jgi:hypothetical protein
LRFSLAILLLLTALLWGMSYARADTVELRNTDVTYSISAERGAAYFIFWHERRIDQKLEFNWRCNVAPKESVEESEGLRVERWRPFRYLSVGTVTSPL